MPDRSRRQVRAMHSALEGHSTLGIPMSAAAKFLAADRAEGVSYRKLPESAPRRKGGRRRAKR